MLSCTELVDDLEGTGPATARLPDFGAQSIEAEESILSAILLENSTLLDVLEILTPDDFYRTAHQRIFAAIEILFRKAEPVDLITLTNALREHFGFDGAPIRIFFRARKKKGHRKGRA